MKGRWWEDLPGLGDSGCGLGLVSKNAVVLMFLELLLVEKSWWVVESLKLWVGKLNPNRFWVWEGDGEHGLGSFRKEVSLREIVKAIDGSAEIRGTKVEVGKKTKHWDLIVVKYIYKSNY